MRTVTYFFNNIELHTHTQLFKSLGFYVHQGCIYLFKKYSKTGIMLLYFYCFKITVFCFNNIF